MLNCESANDGRDFGNRRQAFSIILGFQRRIYCCMTRAMQTMLSRKINAFEKHFEYSRAFVRRLFGFLLTLPQTNI